MAVLLEDEIRRRGPVSFRDFMQTALYHPEHGYYRRARDPFGRHGDFFTAAQLQPVFGRLIAARIESLFRDMGEPEDFTVVDLGAGRREMQPSLARWRYLPVDAGDPLPVNIRGVIFCNEFFDALPVEVFTFREGAWREMRVGTNHAGFDWVENGPPGPDAEQYLRRNFPVPEEDLTAEVGLEALSWMDRIATSLTAGWVFAIDYGYTRAEAVRFPRGTLMSYHRHTAREAVLEAPGERDLTAHVAFTELEEHAARRGLRRVRFETLARTLLDAGEPDSFASALAAGSSAGDTDLRLQLKTLLFGMGETFRTLLLRKDA